jgi:hypothetical protein
MGPQRSNRQQMDESRYVGTVRFLRQRASDSLRTAVAYTDDDWTTLNLREDVRTDELEAWLGTYVDHFREGDAFVPAEEYARLGEREATIELHEDGVSSTSRWWRPRGWPSRWRRRRRRASLGPSRTASGGSRGSDRRRKHRPFARGTTPTRHGLSAMWHTTGEAGRLLPGV